MAHVDDGGRGSSVPPEERRGRAWVLREQAQAEGWDGELELVAYNHGVAPNMHVARARAAQGGRLCASSCRLWRRLCNSG